MHPGEIGAIIGLGGGIIGGGLGTYFNITRTKEPVEKAFLIKAAIWLWLAVFGVGAAMLFTPSPWRWRLPMLLIPFAPLGVLLNRRLERIRREQQVALTND